MKINIVAVGRLRNSGLSALCDEYCRRVARHVAVRQTEVRDDRALARQAASNDFRVALEVGGRAFTSTDFSRQLQLWGEQRGGRVTFLIGGTDGLPADVSAAADAQLSLSTMTLPHRLARVLLCEQIYRAVSLWRGEPYARED